MTRGTHLHHGHDLPVLGRRGHQVHEGGLVDLLAVRVLLPDAGRVVRHESLNWKSQGLPSEVKKAGHSWVKKKEKDGQVRRQARYFGVEA